MISKTIFPCWEHSNRAFIHSPSQNKRIGCNGFGHAYVTENRKEWEEWYIEPANSNQDKFFYIKSKCHSQKYLCSNQGGNVYTCKEATEAGKWNIDNFGSHNAKVIISSHSSKKLLVCKGERLYTEKNEHHDWLTWVLEFSTGELCFVRNLTSGSLLSCDPWGKIEFKNNADGWEVWRFTEVGNHEGRVIISSWTHFPKCLYSTPDGDVRVGDNLGGTWEQWTLEKALAGNGVIIRSAIHGMVLTRRENNSLCTSKKVVERSIWNMDPANKNQFCIKLEKKFLTVSDSTLKFVENCENSSGWEIVQTINDGTVSLRDIKTQKWINVTEDGKIAITEHVDKKGSKWIVKQSNAGGVLFISTLSQKSLSNDGGKLCMCDLNRGGVTWQMEPQMPGTITGGQILAPIMIGVGAALFAVAAPFAVMGTVGILGFGGGGIVAGSTAAGMMSAEAIASGGAIAAGGLVATLQSVGAAGLGVAGTSIAAAGGAVVGSAVVGSSVISTGLLNVGTETSSVGMAGGIHEMPQNRPVCAWKSW